MFYQRAVSAGQINYEEEIQTKMLLQNAQRLLKTITVRNPFAMHLTLPQSVFKPRRTNAHYLQFIEGITFYKQYQKFHHIDKETGEEFIETTIEDIQEANELIKEVLLRKSDTITGASRNIFEQLKKELEKVKEPMFTNAWIRKNLKLPKTTVQRRIQEWYEADLIQKKNGKKTKSFWYEIVDTKEYSDLETAINKALEESINKINRPIDPQRTNQSPAKKKSIKVNNDSTSTTTTQQF